MKSYIFFNLDLKCFSKFQTFTFIRVILLVAFYYQIIVVGLASILILQKLGCCILLALKHFLLEGICAYAIGCSYKKFRFSSIVIFLQSLKVERLDRHLHGTWTWLELVTPRQPSRYSLSFITKITNRFVPNHHHQTILIDSATTF